MWRYKKDRKEIPVLLTLSESQECGPGDPKLDMTERVFSSSLNCKVYKRDLSKVPTAKLNVILTLERVIEVVEEENALKDQIKLIYAVYCFPHKKNVCKA